MTKEKYVVVNGRAYNAVTGMPMDDIVIAPNSVNNSAVVDKAQTTRGAGVASVHRSHLHKSETLNRRHVKQPQKTPLATKPQRVRAEVAKHSAVNKFTIDKPSVNNSTRPKQHTDRPAEIHPIAVRAKAHSNSVRTQTIRQRQATITQNTNTKPQAKQTTILKTAKELKEDAIHAALSTEVKSNKKHRSKQRANSASRWLSRLSIGFAAMILSGYLTYLSMPNISIRMAAVQSGVNAKYPGYKPDGYAMSGPIKFKNGEVSITYAYADGSADYTLSQQKSSWDSSAVKEYFSEKTTAPTTTIIDGLTIYSDGHEAAWVNGGILYQIDGSAELSSEQIQKIATSL